MRTAEVVAAGEVDGAPGLRVFLGHRTWRWWAIAATCARLPGSMAPLGLVLALPAGRGAIVASGYTLGVAVGASWRGRAVDRAGFQRGLRREALLLSAAFGMLGATVAMDAPLAVLIPIGLATGVAGSAVGIGYRAALPSFVPAGLLRSATTLDSTLNEATFIISSPLTATLVAFAPPFTVFAGGAALAVMSGLASYALPREVPRPRLRPQRSWHRSALPVYVIASGVGISFGLLNAGLPERLADLGWSRASAGFLLGIMSLTGVGVGVVVAARGGIPTHRRGIAATLLGVFGLSLAALAVVPDPVPAIMAIALFGVPLAPLDALGTAVLSERVPAHCRSQVFALYAAVITAGSGLGLALAAVLLDLAGAAGTLATGALTCVTLTAVVAASSKTGPRA